MKDIFFLYLIKNKIAIFLLIIILSLVGYVVLILAVNLIVISGISYMLKGKARNDYRVQIGGFLIGGVMAGVVLALSVFGFDLIAALQGGFGGLLSAAWIAFMVPKKLTAQLQTAEA